MDLQLAGKRALVTGSSSGIGSEIARMLAAEGIGVVVHGRNVERTQAVVRQIEDAGGRAAIALGDLMTEDGKAGRLGDVVELVGVGQQPEQQVARRPVRRLRPRRQEQQQLGMTRTRDADVLGILVFLQHFELDRNNGRKRGRAFLDALRRFYSEAPTQPERGSSLVLP